MPSPVGDAALPALAGAIANPSPPRPWNDPPAPPPNTVPLVPVRSQPLQLPPAPRAAPTPVPALDTSSKSGASMRIAPLATRTSGFEPVAWRLAASRTSVPPTPHRFG